MNNTLFKVSVIIPVYNGEAHICRCLDSLVEQSLSDIEVIVINDASTDSTPHMLAEYQKKFPKKIKVITLPTNKKQGGARNAGLDIAQGEYIGFVDADDFVAINMYEELYNKALSQNYDVVDSDFFIFDGDQVLKTSTSTNPALINTSKDSDNYNLFNGYGRIWTKIFKNFFFDKNKLALRFPENLFYEDNYLQPFLSASTEKMGKVFDAFYYYSHNPESTTRSIDNPRYFDRVISATMLLEDFRQRKDYIKYKEEVDYRVYRLGVYHTFFGMVGAHSKIPFNKINDIIILNKKINIQDNIYYKKDPLRKKVYGYLIMSYPFILIHFLSIRLKFKRVRQKFVRNYVKKMKCFG